MTSRLSLNGGETWPTAFILLSSELATPVSALVFARWIIIIEKDNDDDDDDNEDNDSDKSKTESESEPEPEPSPKPPATRSRTRIIKQPSRFC